MKRQKYEQIRRFLESPGSRRVFPEEIELLQNRAVKKSRKANWRTSCKHFTLIEGVLHKHLPRQEDKFDPLTGKVERKKMLKLVKVVQEGEEEEILAAFHGTYHVGRDAMYQAITEEYWWPSGMKEQVARHIRQCSVCERRTKPTWKSPLQPILASRPMERWQIDFTGPYEFEIEKGGELKKKKKMCCLAIDCGSKMLFGTIFSSKHSRKVADWLETKIQEEGPMKILQADNGGEFIGAEVKEVCKKYGVQDVNSSPHHPQSQGQIERANREVKIRLMQCISEGKFNLKKELRSILATKNSIPHSTTKYKPIELHRGRLLNPEGKSPQEEAAIIGHMREQAFLNCKDAAAKSSKRWLENKRVKIYSVDDPVLVRQKNKNQRKTVIWQKSATIHKCNKNYTYRLLWGKDGGYDAKETPGSLSLRCWVGSDLKPRESISSESSSGSDSDWEEEKTEEKGEIQRYAEKQEDSDSDQEENEEKTYTTLTESTETCKQKQKPKRVAKRTNKSSEEKQPSLFKQYEEIRVDAVNKVQTRKRQANK